MPPRDRAGESLRLLAVLAHPDDESLGLGGTLARYSAEGVETSLVTATRGEGGKYRGVREGPEYPGREGLGRIREGELRAAARTLGISDLTILGYPDGALALADPVELACRIAVHIRRLRPHVVLTFPPDGAYGHPDHIAISQAAAAAIVVAADPNGLRNAGAMIAGGREAPTHAVSKLYHMVATEESITRYQAATRKLSVKVDGIERAAQFWPNWLVTTTIDTRAHWQTVWKAVSCHDSQVTAYGALAGLPPERQESLWGTQYFYRAFSTVSGGSAPESDLFTGLRESLAGNVRDEEIRR
jgi:LmbE family N-acetylglucosaminyl deacetylase